MSVKCASWYTEWIFPDAVNGRSISFYFMISVDINITRNGRWAIFWVMTQLLANVDWANSAWTKEAEGLMLVYEFERALIYVQKNYYPLCLQYIKCLVFNVWSMKEHNSYLCPTLNSISSAIETTKQISSWYTTTNRSSKRFSWNDQYFIIPLLIGPVS